MVTSQKKPHQPQSRRPIRPEIRYPSCLDGYTPKIQTTNLKVGDPSVLGPEEATFPGLEQRGFLLVHGQFLHEPLHCDVLVGDVLCRLQQSPLVNIQVALPG